MNELETFSTDEVTRRPSWIQTFFILCSGADRVLLNDCPTEWNKYAGIGATIFFTGILASISGGYALYSIFRGIQNGFEYAIAFGLIWGFVILNLDRFIVSTIRKEGNFERELLQASPRFILAILISIVIAKPLEVRMFEDRIEQQIFDDKLKKMEQEKLSIDKINDLTKLETSITSKNDELTKVDSLKRTDPSSEKFKSLKNDQNQATIESNQTSAINKKKIDQINTEINGIRNSNLNYIEQRDQSGNITGKKLNAESVRQINSLTRSRNELQNEIKSKQKRLADINAEIQKERNDYLATLNQNSNEIRVDIELEKKRKKEADSVANNQKKESAETKEKSYTNNFVTQLESLGNLKDENQTMKITSWMITLLFIVVETSPVLVKLLTKRGPYDEVLERVEYETMIGQKERISALNTKINELLEKSSEAAKLEAEIFIKVEKQRLEYELKNNQSVLDQIAIKQEHLAKLAIEKWYEAELKNVSCRS